MNIEQIKKIAGAWNGKESGIQEDQAMIANEILKKIEELEKTYE